MLYHLFKYFDNVHNLPGAGMFQYISFRAAAAIIIAIIPIIILYMTCQKYIIEGVVAGAVKG